jgi:hypothetical protein
MSKLLEERVFEHLGDHFCDSMLDSQSWVVAIMPQARLSVRIDAVASGEPYRLGLARTAFHGLCVSTNVALAPEFADMKAATRAGSCVFHHAMAKIKRAISVELRPFIMGVFWVASPHRSAVTQKLMREEKTCEECLKGQTSLRHWHTTSQEDRTTDQGLCSTAPPLPVGRRSCQHR